MTSAQCRSADQYITCVQVRDECPCRSADQYITCVQVRVECPVSFRRSIYNVCSGSCRVPSVVPPINI